MLALHAVVLDATGTESQGAAGTAALQLSAVILAAASLNPAFGSGRGRRGFLVAVNRLMRNR